MVDTFDVHCQGNRCYRARRWCRSRAPGRCRSEGADGPRGVEPAVLPGGIMRVMDGQEIEAARLQRLQAKHEQLKKTLSFGYSARALGR